MSEPAMTLRPVGPGDGESCSEAFLGSFGREMANLEASGIPAETRAQLLAHQRQAFERSLGTYDPPVDDLIIDADGIPSGRLVLHRGPEAITIVDISIIPDRQGQGVGRAVIGRVIGQADAHGLPVRLSVVHGNDRALALYLDLGFLITDDRGSHIQLMRSARHANF